MSRLILFVYFIPFLFCGCVDPSSQNVTPPKPLAPPKFAQYDLVNLAEGDQLGYIRGYELSTKNRYKYSVVFRNSEMNYFEDELRLYRRAEWFMPNSKHAEIDSEYFNQNQDGCQETK